MDRADELLCLFSATISKTGEGHVIEVPQREVETGSVDAGEAYRVALLVGDTAGETATGAQPQPPVEPGEIRYVDIEDLGKQGDGIARVERGYVIIIPESDVGDRVKIEITEVKSNFAVGEIIEST